jgi:hypothetical protein
MNSPNENRRSFFRVVLLGALGWICVTLLRRPRECLRSGCEGCALYANCALPQKEPLR